MKKKIAFMGLALAATAAVSFHLDSKSENLDGLMLENIEALAFNEFNPPIMCAGSGSVDCPIGHNKVKYVGEMYSHEDRY